MCFSKSLKFLKPHPQQSFRRKSKSLKLPKSPHQKKKKKKKKDDEIPSPPPPSDTVDHLQVYLKFISK